MKLDFSGSSVPLLCIPKKFLSLENEYEISDTIFIVVNITAQDNETSIYNSLCNAKIVEDYDLQYKTLEVNSEEQDNQNVSIIITENPTTPYDSQDSINSVTCLHMYNQYDEVEIQEFNTQTILYSSLNLNTYEEDEFECGGTNTILYLGSEPHNGQTVQQNTCHHLTVGSSGITSEVNNEVVVRK